MNSYVQLICLIVSFLYGFFINITNNINFKIINNKNIFIKIIISLLYLFNISLLYVVFLYKINNGMLHIYFTLLIFIGYLFSVKRCKL